MTKPANTENGSYRLLLFLSLVLLYPTVATSQHYFRDLDWYFSEVHWMGKDLLTLHGDFFKNSLGDKYMDNMDHEYHLDQSTYLNDFDRNWTPKKFDVIFRNQLRSIDKSHFATRSTIGIDTPMDGRHEAVIDILIQDDNQANRLLADIGYRYRLSNNQRFGVSMTVEQYKPDLDWTFYYEYSGPALGEIDARVVFLDFANNFIFNTIGVDPVLDSRKRSYSSIPILFSLKWKKRTDKWKVGFASGIQPPAKAIIAPSDPENPEPSFANDHFWWFFAGELGYRSGMGELTAFVSNLDERKDNSVDPRLLLDPSEVRIFVDEFKNYSTGLKYFNSIANWSVSADFIYDHFEDNYFYENERDESFEGFTQDEKLFQSEVRHSRSSSKLVLGLGLAFQWRSFENLDRYGLRFRPNPFNSRANFTAGVNFREGALIEIGTSIDLDGDQFYTDRGATRFDGAFGRVLFTMD